MTRDTGNDKISEINSVISEMIGKPYHAPSLIGTPLSFLANRWRYRTKGHAEESKKRAEAISSHAKGLMKELADLEQGQKDKILGTAYNQLLSENGKDTVEQSLPLSAILEPLADSADRDALAIGLEISKAWQNNTRTPKKREHEVADELARIYVEELGAYPSYGNNDREPSGDFCRAVKQVFLILGIEMSFESPCKMAVGRIKNESIEVIQDRARQVKQERTKFASIYAARVNK